MDIGSLLGMYNTVKNNPEAVKTLASMTIPGVILGGLGTAAATIGGTSMATSTGRGIIDIPGYDITSLSNILPGGEPFIVPEGNNTAERNWEYSHVANGVVFYRSGNYRGCRNKAGAWKQWTAYHPTVFGKRPDAGKLAKMIKKHRDVWRELNKVYGKHYVEHKSKR